MKKLLALIIFFLFAVKLEAQYSIKVYNEGEESDKPSGTLAQNEILLVGLISPNFSFQVSDNKQVWKSRKINFKSTFEITLEDHIPYFYVRICNNADEVQCENYRLRPGKKYAIVWDASKRVGKVIAGRN